MSATAHAAPKAEAWEHWRAHDDKNTAQIDHGKWDQFLRSYLKRSPDGINRIAYGTVSAQDRARLNEYLAQLRTTSVSRLARGEQRAYWINLYNALTINVVLAHYPVESITKINISPGWFSRGPWGQQLCVVEGEPLTLDDIEHRILRPLWKDPRTHYSVNCASLGCPNLAERAYTAANMEAQLDAGARAYVNSPRGAHIENGKLAVSSIYRWFKDDFGGSDSGVIAHLRKYAAPPLAAQLANISEISSDQYDWSLNDAK